MKRFLQISKQIFICLMLFSVVSLYGKNVDVNTAKQIATNFLKSKMISGNIELVHVQNAAINGNTTPCYYVFNVENSGFIMVSADDCVRPVLGYSTNGIFDFATIPVNMKTFIQNYQDQISYLIDNNIEGTPEILQEWISLKEGNIVAKNNLSVIQILSSIWNQDDPYNNECPEDVSGPNGHVYAGCVATAMAQIINYWKYPSTGYGNHSYNHSTYGTIFADFENTTYNYSLMPDAITSSSPQAQIDQVATLTFHCAVSVDMDFSPSGSGAYTEDAAAALRMYFGYPSSTKHYYRASYDDATWLNMLKTELEAGRPLLYHGSGSTGHAFVCDGFDETDYFHFNWGWGGYLDGYFSINAMNPGGESFNQNQGAIMGIQGETPSNCESPSNLQVTVSNGNTMNLTWTPPVSVENPRYKIYINSLIKYSNEPSFTITLPITGQVCSKVSTICDNIGEESDPTDIVCVTLYPASIQEVSDAAFNIYPNPANESINIDGENIDKIFVYNILGQLKGEFSVNSQEIFTITTSDYASGIYLIKIVTISGHSTSKRVMISH